MVNDVSYQMQKRELVKDWIDHTNKSIDALFNWRSKLITWKNVSSDIPDEIFMDALNDLADTGLLEWIDGCHLGVDQLREVLTGKEV